ncbi:hypothetical protein [Holdemania filiformis]|uniref:hypothetical protein n=1 Tax=Holdemania filiformis TaxID=61171 RepID=UPI00242DBB5D|nr:hypothetical protein [Holdemania filiformis]
MLTYSVILLILLILVVFLGSALMKKRLAGKLEQALRKKDYDAYRKVIYARSATVFLNPNTILLLRASDQMASGNRDAAKKILPAIRVMRLEAAQKLAYLQLCSSAAVETGDVSLFQVIQKELDQIQDSSLQGMIADLREENEINQSLYGVYDRRVIPVLESQVSRNEGQNRGRLMMSLAKAYYLDGQMEKAKTTLTTAGTLLRGTSLEKVIHLTLSDLRILGNDIAAEENAGI